MGRRNYSNTATATTLSADISSTATSFTVTGTVTGYASSESVLTLDRDQPSEERVKYTTRSGNSFTGVSRGYDGTAAAAHSSGAAVEHTITAADLDEPNNLVNLADAKGDLLVASAADTWSRLPVGANNLFLIADSAQASGVKWAAVETAQPNTSLGTLGYAQITADTFSGGGESDVAGLAVTVTAGANRRLKISAQLTFRFSGAGNFNFWIKEGATYLAAQSLHVTNGDNGAHVEAVVRPSTGTHTYKLTSSTSNAGNTIIASASNPNFILVEDIGAA